MRTIIDTITKQVTRDMMSESRKSTHMVTKSAGTNSSRIAVLAVIDRLGFNQTFLRYRVHTELGLITVTFPLSLRNGLSARTIAGIVSTR